MAQELNTQDLNQLELGFTPTSQNYHKIKRIWDMENTWLRGPHRADSQYIVIIVMTSVLKENCLRQEGASPLLTQVPFITPHLQSPLSLHPVFSKIHKRKYSGKVLAKAQKNRQKAREN